MKLTKSGDCYYVQLRKGRSVEMAWTEDRFGKTIIGTDYDKNGKLLGVEIIPQERGDTGSAEFMVSHHKRGKRNDQRN